MNRHTLPTAAKADADATEPVVNAGGRTVLDSPLVPVALVAGMLAVCLAPLLASL
jgi:hypothetical protein